MHKNAIVLLCDGSTKENTWGVGVSSVCASENWDVGGMARDIPILLEGKGHIDVSVAETLCIIFGLIIGSWLGHEEKTLVIVNDRMTSLTSFIKQKKVRTTLYIAMRVMEHLINECTTYYASVQFIHKKQENYTKSWPPDKLAEESRLRQGNGRSYADVRFVTILNSKLQDVLMWESINEIRMPMCCFRFIQPCALKWDIMDASSKQHITALMMVHGTKWTAAFDNTLNLGVQNSAEVRDSQRSYSSQSWNRGMDQEQNADGNNVVSVPE